MDSSSLVNLLVFQLLDPEISGVTPREQFARCATSPEFAQICTNYKGTLWSSYFRKDILPYLDPDNETDQELKTRYNELSANFDQQSYETVHTLYLDCLRNFVATSWYWSQQLQVLSTYINAARRQSRTAVTVPIETLNDKLQKLQFPLQGYEMALQKRIEWTSATIYKLCEIRRRTKVPLNTKLNLRDPDPTLALQPRKVATFMQFAAWNLDTGLMRELITTFQNWYFDYTTTSYNGIEVDLLRLLIDVIIEIEETEGERVQPLIRLFTEIFIIPTMRNPKGRYCPTYSSEVRERLQPMLGNKTQVHSSVGDHFMESMWEDDLSRVHERKDDELVFH